MARARRQAWGERLRQRYEPAAAGPLPAALSDLLDELDERHESGHLGTHG